MTKKQLALLVIYLDARKDATRAESSCTDGGNNDRYFDAKARESAALKALEAACAD